MPKKQVVKAVEPSEATRPAEPMPLNQDAWEQRLIGKAYSLVEKQIDEGTVSPMVLAQVFKMGTEKYRLEQEVTRNQTVLMEAKTQAIRDSKANDALYAEAMAAMREYSGHNDPKIEEIPNGY